MRDIDLNASITECGFPAQAILKHAYAVAFLNHAVVNLINQYADCREFFIPDETTGDEAIRQLSAFMLHEIAKASKGNHVEAMQKHLKLLMDALVKLRTP